MQESTFSSFVQLPARGMNSLIEGGSGHDQGPVLLSFIKMKIDDYDPRSQHGGGAAKAFRASRVMTPPALTARPRLSSQTGTNNRGQSTHLTGESGGNCRGKSGCKLPTGAELPVPTEDQVCEKGNEPDSQLSPSVIARGCKRETEPT